MSYPSNWGCTATTLDGVEYHVRPIRPDDAQRDRAFISALSPQSRYRRMMGAVRELSPALLDRFVNVDYERDMAFVAHIGDGPDERIIGVARYAADASGPDCEFAVAVLDLWQGRGVGARLMGLLIEYARQRGIHRLHSQILPE